MLDSPARRLRKRKRAHAIHEPLKPYHIRLLTIHAAPPEALVICTLRAYQHSLAPGYSALSYVWGTPASHQIISVNGQDVPATPNLVAALTRVRQPDAESVIWCDALCIDQSDDVEKSEQVTRMHAIFKQARKVLMWLGDAPPDADLAVSLIERAAELARQEAGSEVPNWQSLRMEPISDAAMEDMGLPRRDSRAAAAAAAMLETAWLTRVWIIQEAAAASADSVVMCGRHSLPWIDFGLGCFWFHFKTFFPSGSRGHSWSYQAMCLWTYSDLHLSLMPRITLYYLLNMTEKFHATDPRDKVFALLGIAQEGVALRRPAELVVDYTKSVKAVYMDAARHILRGTPSGIFGRVRCDFWRKPPEYQKGWPTWVPQWHNNKPGWEIEVSVWDRYRACGAEEVVLRKGGRGEVLVLKGVRVDQVLSADDSLTRAAETGSECTMWWAVRKLWLAFLKLRRGSSGPQEDRRLAGAPSRCVLPRRGGGDGDDDDDEAMLAAEFAVAATMQELYLMRPLKAATDFSEWYAATMLVALSVLRKGSHASEKQIAQLKAASMTPRMPDSLPAQISTETAIAEKLDGRSRREEARADVGELHPSRSDAPGADPGRTPSKRSFVERIRHHGVFITTLTGYVGLAAPWAREGDVVAVLYGFPVPVLLRPIHGHFNMVGLCHVPALRQGEAMEIREEFEQWFEIH